MMDVYVVLLFFLLDYNYKKNVVYPSPIILPLYRYLHLLQCLQPGRNPINTVTWNEISLNVWEVTLPLGRIETLLQWDCLPSTTRTTGPNWFAHTSCLSNTGEPLLTLNICHNLLGPLHPHTISGRKYTWVYSLITGLGNICIVNMARVCPMKLKHLS